MDKAKDSNRHTGVKLWFSLLISAFFLYLSLRNTDLHRTWAVILASNYYFLNMVVLLTFFQYLIRAWRWYILLEPIKITRFSNRLLSLLVGFAGNCILPARLGELIRAHFLGQTENISRSSALATVVVERVFDVITLLLVLLIGLLITTFPERYHNLSTGLRAAGISIFSACLLLIAFMTLYRYRQDLFLNVLGRILSFLPGHLRSRIIDMVKNFGLGFVPAKNIFGWILVISYSFLLWFTSLCQIQLIEFSIGFVLPFSSAFLIMSMASLGLIVPSAPGFIGTFHFAAQYAFLFFGISREQALSAAIIWHATFFFPTILLGAISYLYLHFQSVSFRRQA